MIIYRVARPEDNLQLIKLTAASGMSGDIALRIDRKPDFFRLLEMRGHTKVFVALDGEKLIGSLCVSRQQVYVGGEIYPLQYIGDFKVAEEYRKKGIGLELCNNMADYVIAQDADLAFLNVASGNNKPLSFFKHRPNVPDFDNIGIFKIHQFVGRRMKNFIKQYKLIESDITPEILAVLNEYQRRYELGNVVTEERLKDVTIYKVEQDAKIIAVMVLADMMNVKQNVVTKISPKMKWMLRCMNLYASFKRLSKMPTLHHPVKMLYIKYLAIDGKDKSLVKFLVDYARDIAYRKSYSYVSIGLHEKDALHTAFKGILKITFNSVGMLLSIKNNKALVEKAKNGIPFEDYSLV